MIMIILDNVYDDDDNDDDKIDNKAHQVVWGENHSTSIALHPKYSAKITNIFSILFLILDHYCLC